MAFVTRQEAQGRFVSRSELANGGKTISRKQLMMTAPETTAPAPDMELVRQSLTRPEFIPSAAVLQAGVQDLRLTMPPSAAPVPEQLLSEDERARVRGGVATGIEEAPGPLVELFRRSLAKGGYQDAHGLLQKLLAGGYSAFAAPFEAASMAARPVVEAVRTYGAPVAGPEIGDVWREGTLQALDVVV